jgi:hypothetical protein
MAERGQGEEEILRVLREAESRDTVVEFYRKQSTLETQTMTHSRPR